MSANDDIAYPTGHDDRLMVHLPTTTQAVVLFHGDGTVSIHRDEDAGVGVPHLNQMQRQVMATRLRQLALDLQVAHQ